MPFFDQNQAPTAKAEYRRRQSEKELQARMGNVREEIIAALEGITLARKDLSLVRDQMPLMEAALEYSEKYSDAMKLNMLHLLEARRALIETQLRLLENLRELRKQEIELERVSGGL